MDLLRRIDWRRVGAVASIGAGLVTLSGTRSRAARRFAVACSIVGMVATAAHLAIEVSEVTEET